MPYNLFSIFVNEQQKQLLLTTFQNPTPHRPSGIIVQLFLLLIIYLQTDQFQNIQGSGWTATKSSRSIRKKHGDCNVSFKCMCSSEIGLKCNARSTDCRKMGRLRLYLMIIQKNQSRQVFSGFVQLIRDSGMDATGINDFKN